MIFAFGAQVFYKSDNEQSETYSFMSFSSLYSLLPVNHFTIRLLVSAFCRFFSWNFFLKYMVFWWLLVMVVATAQVTSISQKTVAIVKSLILDAVAVYDFRFKVTCFCSYFFDNFCVQSFWRRPNHSFAVLKIFT